MAFARILPPLMVVGCLFFARAASAACGDATCNFGETCSICPEDCCPGPAVPCGDGVCSPGSEDCSSCTFDCCGAGSCGDGILNAGEECDDGNTSPDDGCAPTCTLEAALLCSGEMNQQHGVWVVADDANGSPDVTSWNNIARRENFGPGPQTGAPHRMTDALNGHSLVRFQPEDGLIDAKQWAGFDDHVVIAVVVPSGSAKEPGDLLSPLAGGAGHRLTMTAGPNVLYHQATADAGAVIADKPQIILAGVNTTNFGLDTLVNAGVMVNGVAFTTFSEILSDYQWSTQPGLILGNDTGSGTGFQGDLAELIVFKRFLSADEFRQVHTHLAIRYGITLPADDYRATIGQDVSTELYGHGDFPIAIAGLGQNDCTSLVQHSGRSVDDGVMTIDTGGQPLDSGQYLLWGTNATTYATQDLVSAQGCAGQRVSRVYRFGNKGPGGVVSSVRVRFDLSGFGLDTSSLDAVRLLVDDDTDFASGSAEYLGAHLGGGVYEFSGVNPVDDSYVTVFACPSAACGNGVVEGSEGCDDGNADNGDGCDDSCVREVELLCGSAAGQHAFWVRTEGLSGTTVIGWNDVGGPHNLAALGAMTPPDIKAGGANGDNAVAVTGTKGLGNGQFSGAFGSHSLFVAAMAFAPPGYSRLLLGSGGSPPVRALMLEGPEATYDSESSPFPIGVPTLFGAQTEVNGANATTRLFVNGVGSAGSTSSASPGYSWSDTPGLVLGNTAGGDASFDGAIAEAILFERALSDVERKVIQSYLGIKYSVPQPYDSYLTPSHVEIYSHATHPHDVIGLGRNDCQQFQQLQSRSNHDTFLTVTAAGLGDGEYLLLGHNGGSVAGRPSMLLSECNERIVDRTFRVGTAGGADVAATLIFDTGSLKEAVFDTGHVRLFVDDDGDFSAGATVVAPSAAGAGTHIFDVTLGHGAFLALVSYNDTPTANDFSANVLASGWNFIPLTTHYTTIDGTQPKPASGVSSQGIYYIDQPSDGVVYQPTGYAGSDSVQYTVCSENQCCDTATIDISLLINTEPTAAPDFFVVQQNTAQLLDVLANDSDPQGDAMTVTITVSPSGNATVQPGPNGQVLYNPIPGYYGADSFQYTACDAFGECSAPVVVTISINGAPFAGPDGATVQPGNSVSINVSGNDTDPNGDPLVWSSNTGPSFGTVVHVGGAIFQYTAPIAASGMTSFTYSLCDNLGACAVGTVFIVIESAPNVPPVAVDDAVSTAQDSVVTADVMANDFDPNPDDILNVSQLVAGPSVGSATFDSVAGTITFTPPADFDGVVTITYEVCDDKVPALCDTATLAITVIGPFCGDGACNGVETCDTCSDCGVCVCGNGKIDTGEQCDDGNQVPYDGCDDECQLYDICGAGVAPQDAFWVRADWIPGKDGLITTWDAVSSDYDLKALTSKRRPRFDQSTPLKYFNGHPALNAHPISRDGMRNDDFKPSGAHAVFVVDRRWINAGGVPLMDGKATNTNYAFYNFGNTKRWRFDGKSLKSSNKPQNSRPYIHGFTTAQLPGNKATASFWVDGVMNATTTRKWSAGWRDRGITIADYYDKKNKPKGRYYGHVAEAIVCPTEMSTPDRNKVETYLSVKYGIPIPGTSYLGLDGAVLYGAPPEYDAFVVGVGRQDRQGLNQTLTSSYQIKWFDIAASGGTLEDNQYALLGGDAVSYFWLKYSTVSGYDRVSETTYFFASSGSGGHAGPVDLVMYVPFGLSSYTPDSFHLIHDDASSFDNPGSFAASSMDSGANTVTWSGVTIPDGSFVRFGTAQQMSCDDGIQNGSESDVDCGGSCVPCEPGDDCNSGADCSSLVCGGGKCKEPSCTDDVLNGDEEETDCGGSVCVSCGCTIYMSKEANTCNGLDEDCDGVTDENYDDGIACTASFCFKGPVAQNIPNNIQCNDFNGCTADICSIQAGGCVNINDPSGNPDPTLDDGNPCTDLRCVNGKTVNVQDDKNTPDDGLFCTTQTCSQGKLTTSIAPGYCVHNNECVQHGEASTSAPCGICDTTISQTTVQQHVLSESFESSSNGWSFAMQSGGKTGVTWQRDTWRSSDGGWSLYFGKAQTCQWWQWKCKARSYNFRARLAGTATSPPFEIPKTTVKFTFDFWANVQWYYDRTYLDINDGSGWVTLWDRAESTNGFEAQQVTLSGYGGKTVQIRFRFDTTDHKNQKYEGVYVDNIQLQAGCCFVSSDCDDGHDCTLDYCSSAQECQHVDVCNASCDAKKNILLVLDYSGSMQWGDGTGQSKWESAVDGIDAAMENFEPLMNTGLLLFPSQTDGYCGVNSVPSPYSSLWSATKLPPVNRAPEYWFGASRKEVVGLLSSLWPPGATPMARGIRRAGEVYESGHPSINAGGNYVLLITDGAESCYTGNAANEVLNLYNKGIETFVVGFGSSVDEDVLQAAAINGGHAKSIGDAYYSASNQGEMTQALVDIFIQLASEQCDGIDNDCNGQIDDGVPDLVCYVTCNGVNYPGVQVCLDGNYTECQLPALQEQCDGVDNDCDGEIDEDFELGGECTVGIGQCQNTGVLVCNGLGNGATCSAVASYPTTESCDGVDNDCDGKTDEIYPLGQKCDGPDEDSCTNGVLTCADGGGVACDESESFVEACDGVDNDCDGLIDEGFGIGAPCDGGDADLCKEGTKQCDPSGLGVMCTDDTGDNIEICDGIDNDCDLDIDENFGAGQACDGDDADACKRGKEVCTATGTMCVGDSPNSDEICNGLDDDCDGISDEPGALGCVQYFEDKDKDGHGVGPGQCLCSPTGAFTTPLDDDCDDTRIDVYPGSVEVCDGADQDCDGTVDEDPQTDTVPWVIDCYSGPNGTEDVGICRGGVTECLGSVGFDPVCAGEQLPEVEVCDELDNDCDSITDEEDAYGCTVYYRDVDNDTYGTGPPRCLCEPTGEWDNDNDTDCDDTNAKSNPDAVEVCDGVDNECDGLVDEDPNDPTAKMSQSCYSGPPGTLGVGTCQAGTEVCNSATGTWGPCSGDTTPTNTEGCDGLDTDCDGLDDGQEPGGAGPPESHPCASDPGCAGLSCLCYHNTNTDLWACVAD